MNKSTLLFLSAITALSLCSCGGGEKADESETADTTKTDETKVPVSETFFQVPSPGEMLTFIKMVGGKNNKNVSFLIKQQKNLPIHTCKSGSFSHQQFLQKNQKKETLETFLF